MPGSQDQIITPATTNAVALLISLLLAASPLKAELVQADTGTAALASTPPMGWNSWNHFRDKIDDATVRAQADALVSTGMRDAGYIYVNIDDTWEGERDRQGTIHPNSKFPDMKALGDYLHSKGLRFGLYSSPGAKTCEGHEGSQGHEEQDARTFAEWGVDYLKYDTCSYRDQIRGLSPEAAESKITEAYARMRQALHRTGRAIVFSTGCGHCAAWRWAPNIGANLWRTQHDITDDYSRMTEIGFSQAGLARYARPGRWNDPDMLEVGNGGMNEAEYRTQLSLWALLAAPLIAGNDLTKMNPRTLDMLTHREIIAIDQDAAGHQGDRVSSEGTHEIWSRRMGDGSKVVGLFNRGEAANDIALDLRKLGYRRAVKARNVWTGEAIASLPLETSPTVSSHDVILLRILH